MNSIKHSLNLLVLTLLYTISVSTASAAVISTNSDANAVGEEGNSGEIHFDDVVFIEAESNSLEIADSSEDTIPSLDDETSITDGCIQKNDFTSKALNSVAVIYKQNYFSKFRIKELIFPFHSFL